MEKLETILQAELASQNALEAARLHARDLVKQAKAQAELVALKAERETISFLVRMPMEFRPKSSR